MSISKKAFTLVELLVVIAIIAVLTIALLPQIRGAQGKSRDAARQTAVNQIATAIESLGSVPQSTGTCLDFVSTTLTDAGPKIANELRNIPKEYNSGGVVLCAGGYFYKSYELGGAASSASTGSAADYVLMVQLEALDGNVYGSLDLSSVSDEGVAATNSFFTTTFADAKGKFTPSGDALGFYTARS